MVGRHFIKSGPGTFWIDGEVLKARHAVGRSREHFFDKFRIEIESVSRNFFRIVPGEQKSTTLWPEVKSIGHVNHHGNLMGNFIKRFGGDEHATQRLDRKVDSGHGRDLAGPGTTSIDNDGRLYFAARSRYSEDAAALFQNAYDFR